MNILPTFASQGDLAPLLNKIHHCDALELLRRLPDCSIDMILTSPPYDNLRTYKGFTWDFEAIARESFRVLKRGGVLVWVVGDATVNGSETLTSFRQALYFVDTCGFNLWQTIIWNKPGTHPNQNMRYPKMHEYCHVFSKFNVKTFNPVLKQNKQAGKVSLHRKRQRNGKVEIYGESTIQEYGIETSVWSIMTGYMHTTQDIEAFEHPAMFPEELARRHIHSWSNTGDIVMDYFSGSGTTAKLARNMGRQFLGCDLSCEYVELARTRLNNTDPFQSTVFKDGTKQLSLFEGISA
jgi:DNA modification methylase